MARSRGGLLSVVVAVAASQMLGCAGGDGERVHAEAGSFRIEPGEYEAAFDAAREVLAGRGYGLARVDARQGVIATEPRQTPGFLYLLDGGQGSLGERWVDTINAQRRRVRIEFEPVGMPGMAEIRAPGAPAATPPVDLTRVRDRAIVGRVEAVVERRNTPGRRIETESMRRSGRWANPTPSARSISRVYYVPIRRDRDLAARLAARMERRILERTRD